eukprot:jgi/Psemu1/325546/estExt_fgenesh1_pg.C_2520021
MAAEEGDTEVEVSDSVGRVDNIDSDRGSGMDSPTNRQRGWSSDNSAPSVPTSTTNDEDEDNWSRQVETDDTLQHMASMGTVEETHTIDDDGRDLASVSLPDDPSAPHDFNPGPALIPQPRPQPTMKETLVERERQRRVESERARWKRQFAMAAHAELEQDEEDHPNNANGGNHHRDVYGDSINGDAPFASGGRDNDGDDDDAEEFDRSFHVGPNSVAGTVGEDTVAPIETLDEDNADSNMNYPMERFLKEQHGTGMDQDGEGSDNHPSNRLLGKPPNEATHPVVMERFLQEPPTAADSTATSGYDGGGSPQSLVVPPREIRDSHLGDREVTDSVSPDGPTHHRRHHSSTGSPPVEPSQSPSQEPRVILRLTEAEIQEMAAIDDASRSNAPPSERDDISELGELVSDFGLVHIDHQNMSQGTPVTAMESVTSSMGNQNTMLSGSSSDHCGMDGHSISSNIVASSAGGDQIQNVPTVIDSPPDTPLSTPQKPLGSNPPIEHHIEGFDFDKDNYSTAGVHDQDEVVLVRNEMWSPGLSPDRGRKIISIEDNDDTAITNAIPEYGVTAPSSGLDHDLGSPQQFAEADLRTPELVPTKKTAEPTFVSRDETTPLLERRIPPSVDAAVTHEGRIGRPIAWKNRDVLWTMLTNADQRKVLCQSVFREIRADGVRTQVEVSVDADADADLFAAVLRRASSQRLYALAATMIVEFPVLLWVVSDRLCVTLGRTNHTVLMALLPMIGALSGAVGLQASASTIYAIRRDRVTPETFVSWFVQEMGAALCLGLGMGNITGIIAFFIGGYHFKFALSIGMAHCFSTAIAGGTGTLAPLFSTALVPNDSGTWSGPMVTSIQDLFCSLAVMIVSYQILHMFGPYDIAPSDVCIITDAGG